MSFWGELRRRNVVKVGIAYLVVAWLLAQVIDLVLPTFDAPPWVAQTVLFLLVLGLPLVLIVAWAFEITSDGVKLTANVPRSESVTSVTGRRFNYVVTALLALAVVFMAIDSYVLKSSGESEQDFPGVLPPELANDGSIPEDSDDGTNVLPDSVAVLPFTNLSSNDEDAYFAAAIHEEILNQLAKLSNLSVIARTSVMQYADTTKTIPEIARELNVETVMEGSVRYAGDSILVTAQLIDPGTGSHLWSQTYPGDRSDVTTHFTMQADIAMSIANAVGAEFSIEEQEQIEAIPTQSSEAYDLYLSARVLSVPNVDRPRFDEALVAIERALRIDPNFSDAWALKAAIHNSQSLVVPAEEIADEHQASIEAATRALEIDPTNVSGRINLAVSYGSIGDWIMARRLIDPIEALPLERSTNIRLFIYYINIGDYAAASRSISTLRTVDPLNSDVRGHYLEMLGFAGDIEAAALEYDRGVELFGEPWIGGFWWMLLQLDPSAAAGDLSLPPFGQLTTTLSEYVDRRSEGLEFLRQAYADAEAPGAVMLTTFAMWAAFYGDRDLALELMAEVLDSNATWTYYFWFPAMDEARQLPRFKSLLRETGLVAYWQEYGWPSFCRPINGDDFECD